MHKAQNKKSLRRQHFRNNSLFNPFKVNARKLLLLEKKRAKEKKK